MKRILLLCCIGVCLSLHAEKRITRETFDDNGNRMGWSEYSERKAKAMIQDGYYLYTQKEAKKESQRQEAKGKIPVSVRNNFKVSFTLLFPDFNKETLFAFGFENSNALFQIAPKKIYPIIDGASDAELNEKGYPTLIKKGRDKTIVLEYEKKGRNTIIRIDEMEVYSTKEVVYEDSFFVFQHVQPGTVQVDEIIVEQQIAEDNW